MITSKHIEKIVAVIIAAAVAVCMLASIFSDTLVDTFGKAGIAQEYETRLFDTSRVISVDILMDEDDWSDMLENAINEEYYQCDAVINGTTFYNVAIRPKGNTSLSTIANDPTTNRYSFKLEFDYYVDGQTCFGLDKLVLNNNYADATNIKEAVVYDMFAYLGADASLWNYADISVNGETWGVYLALEAVEDSFMLRNYGVSSGELYKPDSMNFGGAGGMKGMGKEELEEMAQQFFSSPEEASEETAETSQQLTKPASGKPPRTGKDFGGAQPQMPPGEEFNPFEQGQMPDMPNMENMPDMEQPPQREEIPDMGGQKGGMSGNGSDLNYTDDDLDSYSAIWDGEVTPSDNGDHKRVVEALKNISEQNKIEEYLDVDNMLKYMAVHTFSVNLDSLSGSMTHNYYLYEENGRLNLVPWDYNLAFGGFSQGRSGSGATSTVNFPIDTPFSSEISLEDRQIFAALLENEEYLAQYHEYLRVLCDEYVIGGRLKALYGTVRSNINTLVKNDPNAFYSYDEYNTAAETLLKVVTMRAQSISGQLDGSIPSTNNGQNENPDALIDAADIDLSVLGTMSMGGGDRGNRGENLFSPEQTTTEESSDGGNPLSPGMSEAADGSSPSEFQNAPNAKEFDAFPQGMTPPNGFDNSSAADSSGAVGELSSLPANSEESANQGFARQPQAEFDYSLLIWLFISAAAIIAGILISKSVGRKKI